MKQDALGKDTVRITYVGGPTVLIEIGEFRILTDPTFDPAGTQYRNEKYTLTKIDGPRIQMEELGTIDIVLLSHDHHFDNLDNKGRTLLSKCGKVLTTKDGAKRIGLNATGMDPWQRYKTASKNGQKLSVIATPARHGPENGDRGPVVGFVIESNDFKSGGIYISGDTVLYEGVEDVLKGNRIKMAVLNIGAAQIKEVSSANLTFTAQETIEIAKKIPNAIIVPIHYEDWMHLTESKGEIENAYRTAGIENMLLWIDGKGTTIEGF
jgi:L-ascorbate metabolism protein UlaG (beta-lactamase superfamily)